MNPSTQPPPPIPRPGRPFPLLADPPGYDQATWDLAAHVELRAYWLGLFRRHFPKLLQEAEREAKDRGQDQALTLRQIEQAGQAFRRDLDTLEQNPIAFGPLSILSICERRELALRLAGIDDPYRLAKQEENDKALAVLGPWLDGLDALAPPLRREQAMRGVFAGNIFDLGATETAAMFEGGQSVDLTAVRDQLKPRPWFRDDLDPWLTQWGSAPPKHALLFVDNAGPDIVLGMIPFARELVRSGATVCLTSNPLPSLNDITHDALGPLLQQAADADSAGILGDALARDRLRLVHSGNDCPLIDLHRVSDELVDYVRAHPVDLLVLEGMGRAVESNLHARFTVDTLKLAMLKDTGVAEGLGASLYDLVCVFEPASS